MSKYSFLLQGQEPEYFELLPTLRLQKYGGWLVAEAIEQEEAGKNCGGEQGSITGTEETGFRQYQRDPDEERVREKHAAVHELVRIQDMHLGQG